MGQVGYTPLSVLMLVSQTRGSDISRAGLQTGVKCPARGECPLLHDEG